MPKELTHWILAEQAVAGLREDSRLRAIILRYHDSYLGGAILPDTLMHLFRGPHAGTALSLANRFHNTAANSFAPLIRAEQRYPEGLPPETLACLLGVVTHIQTDITFHPFVFALAGTGGIGLHYQIETDMDVHFLQSGNVSPVRHLTELMSPTTRTNLCDTCALLFDPDGLLPCQALEHALKLHCRFQRMYDRTSCKLAVRLLALLAGSPFSEQRHLFYPPGWQREDRFGKGAVKWRHPVSGEQQHTSLEQLADRAVKQILTIFGHIETAGSLAVALTDNPGENLLTGMHGACWPVTEKSMVN